MVFRFTVISSDRNDFNLMCFQNESYNAIERLTIEGRKTKTKVITLANHSNHKQRQSQHGEKTCEQVTNLTREKFLDFKLMTAYNKENPKRTQISFNT